MVDRLCDLGRVDYVGSDLGTLEPAARLVSLGRDLGAHRNSMRILLLAAGRSRKPGSVGKPYPALLLGPPIPLERKPETALKAVVWFPAQCLDLGRV